MTDVITFTRIDLPHGWLSNMSRHSVDHASQLWLTAEHLFQALRFDEHSAVRAEIRDQRSPMAAKMCAKRHAEQMITVPRTSRDLELMRTVLRLKHDQHSEIRRQLHETGDAQLVEDVSRRPSESGLFWGVARPLTSRPVGQNWLGRLWMEIREQENKRRLL